MFLWSARIHSLALLASGDDLYPFSPSGLSRPRPAPRPSGRASRRDGHKNEISSHTETHIHSTPHNTSLGRCMMYDVHVCCCWRRENAKVCVCVCCLSRVLAVFSYCTVFFVVGRVLFAWFEPRNQQSKHQPKMCCYRWPNQNYYTYTRSKERVAVMTGFAVHTQKKGPSHHDASFPLPGCAMM